MSDALLALLYRVPALHLDVAAGITYISNDVANGTTYSVANGIANGITNGVANGITNGIANGITIGRRVCVQIWTAWYGSE